MVKITIELSKLQIQMFINCIDGAIDVKHMSEQDEEIAKVIKRQLSKYL